MKSVELQSLVSSLEAIITLRFPHQDRASLQQTLREIYGTRIAVSVLSCARALFPNSVEIERTLVLLAAKPCVRQPLPSPGAVQAATPKLLQAIGREDELGTVEALADMGVLALCPPPEEQLRRLEFSVGCVLGRVRLIPIVELALLAADLTAYDRARVYIVEAHSLFPRAPELHSLHTVAGMISLSVGDLTEAKEHLAKSIRVCRADGVGQLACMVRAPNLTLATKLLNLGENQTVLRYLQQCVDVWRYPSSPIPGWIDAIQRNQEPDFKVPSILTAMEDPAEKMELLIAEGQFLPEACETVAHEAGPYAGMNVDRVVTELNRVTEDAVRGKLKSGRN